MSKNREKVGTMNSDFVHSDGNKKKPGGGTSLCALEIKDFEARELGVLQEISPSFTMSSTELLPVACSSMYTSRDRHVSGNTSSSDSAASTVHLSQLESDSDSQRRKSRKTLGAKKRPKSRSSVKYTSPVTPVNRKPGQSSGDDQNETVASNSPKEFLSRKTMKAAIFTKKREEAERLAAESLAKNLFDSKKLTKSGGRQVEADQVVKSANDILNHYKSLADVPVYNLQPFSLSQFVLRKPTTFGISESRESLALLEKCRAELAAEAEAKAAGETEENEILLDSVRSLTEADLDLSKDFVNYNHPIYRPCRPQMAEMRVDGKGVKSATRTQRRRTTDLSVDDRGASKRKNTPEFVQIGDADQLVTSKKRKTIVKTSKTASRPKPPDTVRAKSGARTAEPKEADGADRVRSSRMQLPTSQDSTCRDSNVATVAGGTVRHPGATKRPHELSLPATSSDFASKRRKLTRPGEIIAPSRRRVIRPTESSSDSDAAPGPSSQMASSYSSSKPTIKDDRFLPRDFRIRIKRQSPVEEN